MDSIEKLGQTSECDVKEVTTNFSIENVVSYALGLEARSFEDEDSEFKKVANGLFHDSTLQPLMFYISMIFPTLTKILKIRSANETTLYVLVLTIDCRFASSTTENRFTSIVSDSIKYRLEHNILRNDALSYLLSIKKAGTFTDNDVTVALAGFFLEGIETSAVVLTYLLYELAAHPSAQEEVRRDIEEVLEKYEGVVTYEAIQEMKYLDAAFNG